jgi:hypothetical protein
MLMDAPLARHTANHRSHRALTTNTAVARVKFTGRKISASIAATISISMSVAFVAMSVLLCVAADAQNLPDTLLTQIRAGAVRLRLPTDSTSVSLIGAGPFRFLIDLGSNVTIFRKDVIAAAGGRTLVQRPTTNIVSVDSVRFGDAVLEQITGGAYDSLDVDGVLGYNVLRHSSFTIDYPAQRFSLHRRQLPAPDGHAVLAFQLVGRMPFVWVKFGRDSVLSNLDTGASEWFTIPPGFRDSIRFTGPFSAGPTVSNNQYGRSQVLTGRTMDSVSIGSFQLPPTVVYLNPEADTPWLGSSAMRFARWTLDPVNRRVEIVAPPRQFEQFGRFKRR